MVSSLYKISTNNSADNSLQYLEKASWWGADDVSTRLIRRSQCQASHVLPPKDVTPQHFLRLRYTSGVVHLQVQSAGQTHSTINRFRTGMFHGVCPLLGHCVLGFDALLFEGIYRRFGETTCLHLQCSEWNLKFLPNRRWVSTRLQGVIFWTT